MQQVREVIINKIYQWFHLAEALDWQSYDPMDLLQSPYFKNVQRISPFAARVIVQTGMRTGVRLRRLFKIEPHEEAKALSDFLSAAVILCRNNQPWADAYVKTLAERLQSRAINTPNGIGWGLEFPYTTRFVNAPARTPNIYQTTNAIQAFLDCYAITGEKRLLDTAMQGVQFILKDLGCFQMSGCTWFRYWPGGTYPIINIQASLCALFARLGKIQKDWLFLDLADRLAYTVISAQQPDGGWQYSYNGKARFIDGFHTGFILQGLMEYSQFRGVDSQLDIFIPFKKGFDFYLDHLILPEGLPRYYADGPVKADGQNFAQCIQALVICSSTQNHLALASQIWENMFDYVSLNNTDEQPVEMDGRGGPFSRQYTQLRWTVAPVTLASAYLYQKAPGILASKKK